jgi:hypothetical protein
VWPFISPTAVLSFGRMCLSLCAVITWHPIFYRWWIRKHSCLIFGWILWFLYSKMIHVVVI